MFKTARIEIWPELSFSYAKSRVGSQAVAAQAYGLTANNLSLAGGDVEMGQLMFMPQIKWPLGDGRDGAAVANFSLSPRLTCRVTRGVGGGRDLRNRRGTWIFGGLWGWLDPFQCHRGV